ncbi:hypothetical protein [Micromonospora echinospora]
MLARDGGWNATHWHAAIRYATSGEPMNDIPPSISTACRAASAMASCAP